MDTLPERASRTVRLGLPVAADETANGRALRGGPIDVRADLPADVDLDLPADLVDVDLRGVVLLPWLRPSHLLAQELGVVQLQAEIHEQAPEHLALATEAVVRLRGFTVDRHAAVQVQRGVVSQRALVPDGARVRAEPEGVVP